MYSGTLLVTNGTTEEVNRALLDLLKKINELSELVERLKNETANN